MNRGFECTEKIKIQRERESSAEEVEMIIHEVLQPDRSPQILTRKSKNRTSGSRRAHGLCLSFESVQQRHGCRLQKWFEIGMMGGKVVRQRRWHGITRMQKRSLRG